MAAPISARAHHQQALHHTKGRNQTVHQHGQVLSFATADIDTAEGINEVLNEEKRKEHIQLNLDLLKDQTKTFYAGIIHAIDPEAELEIEFQ
ncbi:hypothetical protein SAMN05444817_1072 [Corynebacterium appendicis CIP 107643]|uniref:Uncharacterized protein n=1 Tax=Corynebacterium appendicis CIP 107643 TaxID=1161099 RepID=A0A1N7JFF1_9CORY|nr:hypothetical protein [Corynebacterium appendicis]WJY61271.1 hypothetical protein CAPP_06760 [Corynebacterium appendicis CIP 107643]SIS48083.1 hypothetical protein SAMN05444817_1072 [Corynebacterium appendicis CIP 107643]